MKKGDIIMVKEIKINLIGSKLEKPLAVKKRASRCVQGKCRITSLSDNLSKQMFDDAPTLYLNPTEKMILSDVIETSDPVATVLGSGDFAIESSFHNVNEILTFDINSNQYYSNHIHYDYLSGKTGVEQYVLISLR